MPPFNSAHSPLKTIILTAGPIEYLETNQNLHITLILAPGTACSMTRQVYFYKPDPDLDLCLIKAYLPQGIKGTLLTSS